MPDMAESYSDLVRRLRHYDAPIFNQSIDAIAAIRARSRSGSQG